MLCYLTITLPSESSRMWWVVLGMSGTVRNIGISGGSRLRYHFWVALGFLVEDWFCFRDSYELLATSWVTAQDSPQLPIEFYALLLGYWLIGPEKTGNPEGEVYTPQPPQAKGMISHEAMDCMRRFLQVPVFSRLNIYIYCCLTELWFIWCISRHKYIYSCPVFKVHSYQSCQFHMTTSGGQWTRHDHDASLQKRILRLHLAYAHKLTGQLYQRSTYTLHGFRRSPARDPRRSLHKRGEKLTSLPADNRCRINQIEARFATTDLICKITSTRLAQTAW